jgi:hypothetical protein
VPPEAEAMPSAIMLHDYVQQQQCMQHFSSRSSSSDACNKMVATLMHATGRQQYMQQDGDSRSNA